MQFTVLQIQITDSVYSNVNALGHEAAATLAMLCAQPHRTGDELCRVN